MKLVFVIKGMHQASGGAERILAELLSYLVSRGHEITLVSFDAPDKQSFYSFDSRVRWLRLGIGNARAKAKIGETLGRVRALRSAIIDLRPNVTVGFMHSVFVLLGPALVGTGIPVIGSEHIVPAHYRDRKLEFLLFLASSLTLEKITVVSERIRQSYPKLLRHKMVPIANPVGGSQLHESTIDKLRRLDAGIILSVGRLERQKDHLTLIEAFSRISREFPGWNLRIVGEGQLRDVLQARIRELGLAERAFLPGVTDDISEEYENADLFVTSSLYESFGLATAEAMAHGLPAIGFEDCEGTNELIESGISGLLVPPGERVCGLANALRYLILDIEARLSMSNKAVERIRCFAPETVFRRWEALLSSVASHHAVV